jgi:hypothetical protein
MSVPTMPPDTSERPRRGANAGQVWSAGLATALVAALIALVGILISRWLLHIPILAPRKDGAWGNAVTGEYMIAAACVALVATALLHLLMLGTPAPGMFLAWITGLATVAAVVYPFSTGAPISQKAATAIVNLVIGIAISSLLSGVAARGYRRPPGGGPGQRYPEAESAYPRSTYSEPPAYDRHPAQQYRPDDATRPLYDPTRDPRQ